MGTDNEFGHPSPEVIKNIENAGAIIFRTDIDGTIVISTDGNSWDVESLGKELNLSNSSYQLSHRRATSPIPKPTQRTYSPIDAPVIA